MFKTKLLEKCKTIDDALENGPIGTMRHILDGNQVVMRSPYSNAGLVMKNNKVLYTVDSNVENPGDVKLEFQVYTAVIRVLSVFCALLKRDPVIGT